MNRPPLAARTARTVLRRALITGMGLVSVLVLYDVLVVAFGMVRGMW